MSSNPQWKMFQPPDSHSSPLQEILDLQQSNMQAKQGYRNGTYSSEYPSSPRDNYHNMGKSGGSNRFSLGNFNLDSCPMGDSAGVYSSSSNNSQPQYDSMNHPPIRETGIIEKLLHSYGFIQCCERQARLFFHFSQFGGNIDHLKIGDPVEFEMTYDRRTGKPIASTVTKIAPEVVLSEARVTGVVTTEVKGEGSGDSTGRISYENRGECFFLPYTKDDVEGNVTLRTGDAVSFQIATNQRGTLGACHVRFENPAHPVKYHGVVCSKKENFGFIERADVVKEIFFHYSEAKIKEELSLGDDVEFIIQTRNGKEVACNITKLPSGSVVFEDVSPEIMRGQVLKPLERGNMVRVPQNDPLPGRIRYRAADHSEVEVPFGDKDQCGEFTLRHGDWVQFQVATDRRDQLKRATNISLLDESFNVSGERREQGVVSSLKEGFGFIRCVEREQTMFFHFAEVLRLGQELSVGDEVEFTVDPVSTFSNMNTRQSAIRIKHLSPGTVQFETLLERGVRGIIAKEAQAFSSSSSFSPTRQPPVETGIITCQINNMKKSISYTAKKCESKMLPRVGDKVTFDIYQVKRTKELIAMSIQIQHSLTNGNSNGGNNMRPIMQGFIAALKDGFGFIETADHTKEVFFHFSNLEGSPDGLELGTEVEYSLGRINGSGGGCASAEFVRVLPRGSVTIAKPLDPTLNGTVTRTLRALNPDQAKYSGLIQMEGGTTYEFGIMGLACKREILQVGDPVTFQADVEGRATNIIPIRKKRRATVDAIKGGFGFLSIEGEDNRRLFFHMSEVRGNPSDLQSGDSVEFVMLTNPRNGKSSACNVVKVGSKPITKARSERPERLLARLRTVSLEDSAGPRVVVARAPRGPDGSRGFRPRRPLAEQLAE
ncbi:cold shock domain-containing protein E1 isoform X1 [Vanessa tameamea]|uniref:Cold shock domain-containing protein E1 isoform X1 n=1 Tax=Vanessa tameamea TaxID=334116 RepID=A0A8B8IUT0_VANTA|nr:cold shock domain-containing protein E1 isoform X1 [Vanessa tameamea]XP_026500311.1 cold shock domain-containing protein E1 isoform X1 [Vanessa tameamea]XP_026500312.1 cold shock domain-containing protein E1 isoform X1 [Vanessa tameamea]XP_047543777.1 cold shock domain-containing protein E1 isoform X1 [Vanessa atalanta]XP_047543778.1 cold shock domain-containing protein E1 isoform X1 [Vanessa atalanta]XP_047543779.1 cold shock domain-containing protein E1 isoform X1 [Vanessa atalanta]